MTEGDLMWKFIQSVPWAIPTARPFRRSILNVEAINKRTGEHFRAKAGVEGQCDIYLLLRGGRIVEVETKARRGVLSPAQRAWRAFCLEWGIPHIVLQEKRGETPDETVNRWLGEIRAVVAA
jgi:hypothetical protein